MQIMYVLTFIVALIVLASTGAQQDVSASATQGSATAVHLATWHRAAHDVCLDGGCTGGPIAAASRLHPSAAAGPAFSQARFTSRYDPSAGILVTYMNPSPGGRAAAAEFGTVTAALSGISRGESSHIGSWDAATRTVRLASVPPGANPRVPLAAPFMGGTIPDRSPVMISRP